MTPTDEQCTFRIVDKVKQTRVGTHPRRLVFMRYTPDVQLSHVVFNARPSENQPFKSFLNFDNIELWLRRYRPKIIVNKKINERRLSS